MSDRNQDQAVPASREALESKPKYLDKSESRPIVLGRLQTDEEARLAAEIEKLRDKV